MQEITLQLDSPSSSLSSIENTNTIEIKQEIPTGKLFFKMLKTNKGNIEITLEKYKRCIEKQSKNNKGISRNTKEYFICKYGEETGSNKFKEMCEKRSKALIGIKRLSPKLRFIHKYGEEKGLLEYEKWKETISKVKKGIAVTSKEAFIKRYGEIKGLEKHKEFCEINSKCHIGSSPTTSKEAYIKRYGEEEGIKKFNDYIKNQRNKHLGKATCSKEAFILKCDGNKEKGLNMFEEWCEKISKITKGMIHHSKDAYIKRYGEELGIKKHKEFCKTMSRCRTQEAFIKKYGKDEGKKRYAKSRGSRYSKISQKLFWLIFENLSKEEKEQVYFAENKKEFRIELSQNEKNEIENKAKNFFLDFKFKNKIIEYDGKYWHTLKFRENYNKKRKEILEKRGYKILLINENEFSYKRKQSNEIIEKCLRFLRE